MVSELGTLTLSDNLAIQLAPGAVLRLRNDAGVRVAHLLAREGLLDSVDPALLTPELLGLRNGGRLRAWLFPDYFGTVGAIAVRQPQQLSRLLSRIPNLSPEVQTAYRKVMGERFWASAKIGLVETARLKCLGTQFPEWNSASISRSQVRVSGI